MNVVKFCLMALIACAVASTASAQNWLKKVEYKQIDGGDNLELHICNPPHHTSADKSPAVIFFFGGGWVQGKPGQFYPFIKDLAEHGIVAISAQYRTKSSHGVTPIECVEDAKSAIRYVREHAAELGVDPDKIIAGGGSAGGHIAACTVIPGGPEDATDNQEVSCRPQALLLLNPVLSVGPDGYQHNYIQRIYPQWELMSPFDSVDGDVPPTLIQVGTADKLLPVTMAEQYKVKMDAAGNRCEVVYYEGQEHGFFNRANMRPDITKQMVLFLTDLGYIQQ